MKADTESDKICDIEGCNDPAERSLNIKKFKDTDMKFKDSDCKQVHLCKDHYRAFKKETKNSIPDYLG